MRRLTITLRISAWAALTGLAFAVFMVSFFPAQAAKVGSRMMADSAVTIANVFAANIAPAFALRDQSRDQIFDGALLSLAGESATRPGELGSRARIASATIFDTRGNRLAGYADGERAHDVVDPHRSLVVEPREGEGILRVFAPVYQEGAFAGFFRIDFATETFAALVRQSTWISALAALCMGCALIGIAFFVGHSIAAPMARVAGAMQTLSTGAGDLAFRLNVESRDEVGELARSVNSFLAKLQGLVSAVAENAATLSASSDELASLSDRLVENGESVSQGATAVAERTHEMSASIEAVTTSAQEATRNVSAVTSSTDQMSQNMAQVSLAAEAVASNAVEVEGSIRDISDAMATIRGNTEKAATVSRQGAEKATPVQQLLRELTESAEATKKIELQISDMQSFTRQSVGAIGQIIELMEGAHAINSAIAKAVEDQTHTSAKVFEATSDSTKMIADVTGNIGEASNMAAEVAGKASDLMRGMSTISENAARAAQGATEVSAHIESVRSSSLDSSAGAAAVRKRSQELLELSAQLKSLVGQFRT